jgi:hypothetical protein
MFSEFVWDRLEKASKPLSDAIPIANVYTFSNQPPVDWTKGANKLGSAKVNTAFITELFLSLQAQSEVDIDYFFKQNLRKDPALSDQGKLMSGTKSLLLSWLPGMVDPGFFLHSSRPLMCVICQPTFIRSNSPRPVHFEITQKQLLPFMQTQMTNNITRIVLVGIHIKMKVINHTLVPKKEKL